MIEHVTVAVSNCCSVRADNACNTVLEVLCVPPGVAALDAAGCGRRLVCTAALPFCVTSLVTRTLSVQCSDVCVALRWIGLSAAVVAQQRWRCAGVGEAAVVLSDDTSSCSCNVVVLLFCMCVTRGIRSLFSVAVLRCVERLFARAWYRCVSRCDVRDRRSVAALSSGMTVSGTCGLSGCIVFGGTRTRCCA